MKKVTKGLILVAGAAALYAAYRLYKKEQKKVLEAQKSDDEGLEDLGLDPETFRDNFVPGYDDSNLVKYLFASISQSSQWDADIISEALDDNTPVYITQREYRGEYNLDIYFEFPRIVAGESPSMGDYILSLKDLKAEIFKELKSKLTPERASYAKEPYHKLEGFINVGYANGYQELLPIPSEIYSQYADPANNRDGLTDFVIAVHSKDKAANRLINEAVLNHKYGLPKNVIKHELVIMMRMEFKIAKASVENSGLDFRGHFNVDLPMALDILRTILEKFKLKKRFGGVEEGIFQHFIFIPPEEDGGKFRTLQNYEYDDQGNIVAKPYDLIWLD